jgi:hypothetical protein
VLLRPDGRRTSADARVVAVFLAGTLCGALLTATVAWVISGFTEPVPDGARVALLAAAAAAVWSIKHGPLAGHLRLPEARRQIPAEVFGPSLVRGAYRFGFELATGVRTYAPSAAPYVLLLTVLLLRPSLGLALLMGAGFGVGRAAPLIARLARGRATPRLVAGFSRTPATVIVLCGGLTLV